MRSLRDAVAFLTRIPIADDRPLDAAALSRAAFWFPAVGLLVGGIMGGTYLVAELAGVPAGPATVLALVAAVLITGGFHEDGLADAADAAGAHVSRERKLEILRDSRVGTYGSLGVVLPLLLAYSALSTLDGEDVLRAALVGHVLGRWATLPASRLAQARPSGSGTLVRASVPVLVAGTVYAFALAVAIAGPGPGALAAGVAVLLTALGGLVSLRVFGGVSGDTFGATNKVVEVATYAVLVSAWS
jgi:adenosylcobinamide-GDP ribazoletransferase